MASKRGITELLVNCQAEFASSSENGDNKRKLVKLLQEMASCEIDPDQDYPEIEKFLKSLWNNSVLLEDCILVSGLIYTKINSKLFLPEICSKVNVKSLLHNDWVVMSLIRGALLASSHSSDLLKQMEEMTIYAIETGISNNRIVLISRHLENLLHIYTVDTAYNIEFRGQQINSIINRTLRLNSDLTDYKSRDLVKFHLNILKERASGYQLNKFALDLLDCLPEMNKTSVQIFDSLCTLDSLNPSIHAQIFKLILPCLSVKGGLGSAAAQCIAKLLGISEISDSGSLLNSLIGEIMTNPSSKETIKMFKLVFAAVNDNIKGSITKLLLNKIPDSTIQLLLLLAGNGDNSTAIEALLSSGDEFVALEAFSLLSRDSIKQRRKPSDPFSLAEMHLFQKFMEDVIFSGSVDFRQKVSVSAKSFYEQLFARIYYLIRELSKKTRESTEPAADTQENKNKSTAPAVVIDPEALTVELLDIFTWLGNYVKGSLIDPFDFCTSNFGSIDFAFTQILGIFSAFHGNATLVAANPSVLARIADEFHAKVIEFALIPAIGKFVKCIGKSTYDSLRTGAIEIVCKCKVDASVVPLNDYLSFLEHARAIDNEGAARIVLLHARLSLVSQFSLTLDEITSHFELLKADFPISLRENNINGRMLLLRFLLQDRPELDEAEIARIINLSIDISEFVSVIASHPSPEGLSVMNIDDEEEDEIEDEADVDDSGNNAASPVSSQYVLSFSWRAVKETSSLMEILIKNYPTRVSKEQVQAISEHFITLLLKLRHCGAFRALQTPLSTALRIGYNFTEKTELLENVLEVCLGTGQIATTRRSAGLPFLVLALAHSCSGRGNELSQFLSKVIPPLLKTAASASNDSNDLAPSTIHSFNIIRSLVRDSRISSEMGSHMAPIAELCLGSFNSAHWNVRNASAMLLSSLIARIFGPKHVNDLAAHDHHVDLREIEVKFEGLANVITSFLEIPSDNLEPRIAYPLLAVLERVRIPPQERFDNFRSAVISFLLKLFESLEKHPENGKKLAHVMGRTVFSLLHSKSFSVDEIKDQILVITPKSSPNGVYNFLILFENVLLFDPTSFDVSLLPPIHPNWHPFLISKYNQIRSHKSSLDQNFPVQIGTPVNNSETIILSEIHKRLPNLRLIRNCLSNDLSLEIILRIISCFQLNEEILSVALPILCRKMNSPIDERVKCLLTFYSSADKNENLRLILLSGLAELKKNIFQEIPQCIFNLLLDDDEEIRNEICIILSKENTLNPAATLRKFIGTIEVSKFIEFLDKSEENQHVKTQETLKTTLFEKEPLNLFMDLQYLRKKF